MLPDGWKVKSSRSLVETKWIKVVQDDIDLPESRSLQYTYVLCSGSVIVVPVTAEGGILLIESYRYPLDRHCLEVPAGSKAGEVSISSEDLARRELVEETGYEAGAVVPLGNYWFANGIARYNAEVFLALECRKVRQQSLEAGEIVTRMVNIPLSEAESWVCSGRLNDGESAFAVFLALSYLKQNG